MHLLFDELAEQVFKYVDTLAERVTALGGVATGTVRMAASSSSLQEFPSSGVDGVQCAQDLASRYAKCAASARSAIDAAAQAGDQGSCDIFIDMVRDLDKALWFLEAHVQQPAAGRVGLKRAA
jgi:starvation-inducible DNA-binding protein